jgi:hypothetical protein
MSHKINIFRINVLLFIISNSKLTRSLTFYYFGWQKILIMYAWHQSSRQPSAVKPMHTSEPWEPTSGKPGAQLKSVIFSPVVSQYQSGVLISLIPAVQNWRVAK